MIIKNKDWFILGVFTLVTVLAWMLFHVYHAGVTSTITRVQEKLMSPLVPQIDPVILEKIRQRRP